MTWDDLYLIADRVCNLIRAFWIREYGKNWNREMDVPPARWFEEPLTKGPLKGTKLDKTKYDTMLQMYYQKRGWDGQGMPTKTTLNKLGLADVTKQIKKYVK
jgi:aldehyde:ferredoxin oxidoreductase